jgi:hypothetical protein
MSAAGQVWPSLGFREPRAALNVEYAENSRAFAVRDPEGNAWSFGQYAGE